MIFANRRWFKAQGLDLHASSSHPKLPDRTEVAPSEANVLSSEVGGGMHKPVLDLDVSAWMIPSSTPGHTHLYIDKQIPWPKYKTLLQALADAEVLERGYVRASIERQATFVRLPWVTKGTPEIEEEPPF